MFGKVNPAPTVSRCVRMVFWSFPEPLEPGKTIKNTIQISGCTFLPGVMFWGSVEGLHKMEGFESHFYYIDIPKNMNIEMFRCLVKSIRPLLSKCVRMVFRSLLAPLKPPKTSKNEPET